MENTPRHEVGSRRGRILAVIGVAALLVVSVVATGKWNPFAAVEPVDYLRLGAYEGDVGVLEWIAKDQGFFERVGLAVEVKGYASGKDATEALNAGQVDVATASEYVVASRSFTEPNLRILCSIAYYGNKGIIGRRDRKINQPGDLKGKRIGVTSPSGAEYSLNVFLALHGLAVQDVIPVHLSPPQIVESLAKGDIDAAITWQPHVQNIEKKLGDNAVSFLGDGLDTYLLVLVTHQEKLAVSSKALDKLMRALILAEEWVVAHPEEAKHYLSTRFKLDAAYVEGQWRRMQLAVTLPQELLIAMGSEARWLASRDGQSAAIPNYAGFIWPDPLKAAAPLAVTLYSDAKLPGKTPTGTPAPER